MIESIKLITLRNAEFLQFSKDVLSIISLNDPAALNVASQYADFKADTEVIENLFKTDRSNPITTELEALDARRDNALNGIAGYAQSLTYHFDPAMNAAAKTLSDHLAVFGSGITRENYQSETASINGILNDWAAQPGLQAAITSLQLGSWVVELDTANKSFNTQYIARTQQLAATPADTIKAKRLEAAGSYYSLRDRINAYFVIKEGAEPFNKTTNEINALVAQYNQLVAGRSTPADTPAPTPPVQ